MASPFQSFCNYPATLQLSPRHMYSLRHGATNSKGWCYIIIITHRKLKRPGTAKEHNNSIGPCHRACCKGTIYCIVISQNHAALWQSAICDCQTEDPRSIPQIITRAGSPGPGRSAPQLPRVPMDRHALSYMDMASKLFTLTFIFTCTLHRLLDRGAWGYLEGSFAWVTSEAHVEEWQSADISSLTCTCTCCDCGRWTVVELVILL